MEILPGKWAGFVIHVMRGLSRASRRRLRGARCMHRVFPCHRHGQTTATRGS